MNKIFVATTGWQAIIDKNSEYYKFATKYFCKLRDKEIPIITSNFVMDETLTWVNEQIGHNEAVKVMELWQEAEDSNLMEVFVIDKKIEQEAREIFKRYSDYQLSFTDATTFALCRKYEIKKIFGFDRDFNTIGFLLNPYRVHEEEADYKVLAPDV